MEIECNWFLFKSDYRTFNGNFHLIAAISETNGGKYQQPIVIHDTTCVRGAAFKEDWLSSPVVTHTYMINASPRVTSLPVFSIVGDEGKSLYEPDGVMAIVGGHYGSDGAWVPDEPNDYNHPIHRGIKYERPVSLEMIHPLDNSGVQENCGIRVHGSEYHRPRYHRGEDWMGCWNKNKFSFKFYFRSDYGMNRLIYPLFPLATVDRYRSVVLRGGHNDSCNPFIIDELYRRLHKDMGAVETTGRFVNVFINGEYKGYFNPCERVDEEFLQAWYDTDSKWDIITHRTVRDGDRTAWDHMLDYARNHDMTKPAHYQELGRRLDIRAFIDYLLVQLYSANWDWPLNNWIVARERSDAGKFRLFVWDIEGSMERQYLYTFGFDHCPSWMSDGGRGLDGESGTIPWLYQALKVNLEFRQLFADRFQKHFYNEGALTEARITQRFLELQDELSAVIPLMNTYTIDTWVPQRWSLMKDACIQEDMFTFVGPEFYINDVYQQGGYVSSNDILTLIDTEGAGRIWYTLDGTDPRLPSGGINTDHAKDYEITGPVILTESKVIKARILSGNTWSGLNDTLFAVGDDPWPTAADGTGAALHKQVPFNTYGNDVAHWHADTPSPGSE